MIGVVPGKADDEFGVVFGYSWSREDWYILAAATAHDTTPAVSLVDCLNGECFRIEPTECIRNDFAGVASFTDHNSTVQGTLTRVNT